MSNHSNSIQFFWFIPTHGDGRYLGSGIGARTTTAPYLRQIAQAIDDLGYYGALLPTGRMCDDAWVVASTLVSVTRRMRFLVAVRPGLLSPTLAARMTSTFDRLSDGRLLINVVTGGDPAELAGDGVFHPHDTRYEVTDEFLSIWRRLMTEEEIDHEGRHLTVKGAKVLFPGVQCPHPPLFFGGSSPAAHQVAAKHVDVYLTWGEPPAAVAEKISDVRRRAAALGRTVRFGMRVHIIVRETASEAWVAAGELLRHLSDETIQAAQKSLGRLDSAGQKRMISLHKGSRDALEVSPNLWAGVGLVRGGAGTALVGDPETVAERIREYAAMGIEYFILSGYPHLEEAYRVTELLSPIFPNAFETGPRAPQLGEIVGYDTRPKSAEPAPATRA